MMNQLNCRFLNNPPPMYQSLSQGPGDKHIRRVRQILMQSLIRRVRQILMQILKYVVSTFDSTMYNV
jgi:hypothetical protein